MTFQIEIFIAYMDIHDRIIINLLYVKCLFKYTERIPSNLKHIKQCHTNTNTFAIL